MAVVDADHGDALAVDDHGREQLGRERDRRRPLVGRVSLGVAQHRLLARGDHRADGAGVDAAMQAGGGGALVAEVRHHDLLALVWQHPDRHGRRVSAAQIDGLDDRRQYLVDGLGRGDRAGHLGREREPARALLGLVPQAHRPQGDDELLGHRAHERRVGGVEAVAAMVVEGDGGRRRALEHGRDERRLVGERRGVPVQVTDDDLLARRERAAGGAGGHRQALAFGRFADAHAVGDDGVLVGLGHADHGGHGAVVGGLEDGIGRRAQHRLHAVGVRDRARDGGGQRQALGAALGLVAQAHPAQRGRQLLRDGRHERLVGVVELVHRPARDLDHRDAAAVQHHRRREERVERLLVAPGFPAQWDPKLGIHVT